LPSTRDSVNSVGSRSRASIDGGSVSRASIWDTAEEADVLEADVMVRRQHRASSACSRRDSVVRRCRLTLSNPR
jgi:hypothetical protein